MPGSGIAGSSGRNISSFLKNHQIDFQSGCNKFVVSPAMEKCSPCCTSSPACDITPVFDFSHFDWCKMNSQSCFDLHFPDD